MIINKANELHSLPNEINYISFCFDSTELMCKLHSIRQMTCFPFINAMIELCCRFQCHYYQTMTHRDATHTHTLPHLHAHKNMFHVNLSAISNRIRCALINYNDLLFYESDLESSVNENCIYNPNHKH